MYKLVLILVLLLHYSKDSFSQITANGIKKDSTKEIYNIPQNPNKLDSLGRKTGI